MPLKGKSKNKIQEALGKLRSEYGWGSCWVCGSLHGVKAGRVGYATRCKRCVAEGKTNEAVEQYAALKLKFQEGNRGE